LTPAHDQRDGRPLLLWLSDEDVRLCGARDPHLAVRCVEQVLESSRAGRSAVTAEGSVRVAHPDRTISLYQMAGLHRSAFSAVAGDDALGQKVSSHASAVGPGQSIVGASLITLFDPADGHALAVMDGADITYARTAAICLVAIARLWPEPVEEIALLGAGRLAQAVLSSLCETLVPDLRRVHVWTRRTARAAELRPIAEGWGVELSVCDDAIGATQRAPVAVIATGAMEPYITRDHVPDGGALWCHVGRNDLRFSAIAEFDTIVTDAWAGACETSEQSVFRMWRAGRLGPDADRTNLPVTLDRWDRPPGQAHRPGKVLFGGFGLIGSDVALAQQVYRRAVDKGLGVPLTHPRREGQS
jgi:ornithine cyclodeaminase/alanine dehydrogenase-like protein (mu-crystallin family)